MGYEGQGIRYTTEAGKTITPIRIAHFAAIPSDTDIVLRYDATQQDENTYRPGKLHNDDGRFIYTQEMHADGVELGAGDVFLFDNENFLLIGDEDIKVGDLARYANTYGVRCAFPAGDGTFMGKLYMRGGRFFAKDNGVKLDIPDNRPMAILWKDRALAWGITRMEEYLRQERSTIGRDELAEYAGQGIPRVRLFTPQNEIKGDGLLRQRENIFYVRLDWDPGNPCYIKPGDTIGIEVDGMMGFHPRKAVL